MDNSIHNYKHNSRLILDLAISSPHLIACANYQPFVHHIRALDKLLNRPFDHFSNITVVVIGTGGLGSHAVLCLADLGFNILLIDPDTVEQSNCHRQNYTLDQTGSGKSQCTFDKIFQHFEISPQTNGLNHNLPWIAALNCQVQDVDFLSVKSHYVKPNNCHDVKFHDVIILDLCDNDITRSYVEHQFIGLPIFQCRLGTVASEVHYIQGFVSLQTPFIKPTPRDQTTPRYSCLAAVGYLINVVILYLAGNLQPGIYIQQPLDVFKPNEFVALG